MSIATKIPQVNTRTIISPNEHYEALHANGFGSSWVWQRQAAAKRWTRLSSLDASSTNNLILTPMLRQPDTYMSVNEFSGWRLMANLKTLKAAYVDIDAPLTPEQALEACQDNGLPPPNMVMKSGRGIHLYWVFEEPVTAAALPVYQLIQNKITSTLKDVGADPVAKDATRILRLAGTVNSKNDATVEGFVFSDITWTFRELANEVLGYREPRKAPVLRDFNAAKAARKDKAVGPITGSIYNRWYLVYQDLLHIARGQVFGIPEGQRHNWLFLTANALSWFANPLTLKDELKHWAIGLSNLNLSDALNTVSTVMSRANLAATGEKVEWNGKLVDPRYHFKRETLSQWVEPMLNGIGWDELRAVVPTEIIRERKTELKTKLRRKNGSIARAEYESSSIEKAKPWEEMGISRRTYFRRKAKAEELK